LKREPKDSGKLPINPMLEKSRKVSLKREPRDLGMLPVNPLLERSLHIH
jgi:hypothetical protein